MKVISLIDNVLKFEDGTELQSLHDQDCCESHYLDFTHITIDDFNNLWFDLSKNDFFERVKGYGIRLLPKNGHPIAIPGYGYNNGYYSHELSLVVKYPNGNQKIYDITECQTISDN